MSDLSSLDNLIPSPGTPLPRRDPLKRIPDEAWPAIRHLIESGVKYDEVAARFGVKPSTLRTRASKERWLTPQRLALAKNGNTKTDDPALTVVEIWRQRGAESRDMLFQGSRNALERFFALSPTPQSFQEASTAAKLMNEAIDPNHSSKSQGNTSIQILASPDFQPTPTIDV